MSITEDFMSAVQTEMDDQGDFLVTALREEVNRSGMSNRGRLAGGFEFITEASRTDVTLTATGVRYALFASAARTDVGEGTRPGYWPDTQAIKRWVQTKLSPPEPEVPSVTYLVSKSIHDHGTPSPQSPVSGRMNWAERALDRRVPKILDALEDRIQSELE